LLHFILKRLTTAADATVNLANCTIFKDLFIQNSHPQPGHESLPDEPRTEMSSCNTSSWLRDHNMDADIHSYARGRLLQRDEYFFRLWAEMPKSKKKKSSK